MLTWEKITSRESIGKFLLKLPNGFFPSYRCVISVMPETDNNPDLSKDIVLSQREDCQIAPPKAWKKRTKTCKMHSQDNSPLQVPPPPPFPFHLLLNSSEIPKITAGDMAKVKLKKTKFAAANSALTPARDIMQVLKRRYTVMHSPTPKKLFEDNYCYDDEDLDD